MQLGNVPVLAVRLLIPFRGAWVAECDLDLGSDEQLPVGRQILKVGLSSLSGTVDPRGTGRFGEKARARVVAGAGAWDTTVKAQWFHNDAPLGVRSSEVITATASQIGEAAVIPASVSYGTDFVRSIGPAARVLDGLDWYVDSTGVTQVKTWPTLSLDKEADVLSYDPDGRKAEIAADDVLWPGTTLTDIRFGTLTIREVDQRFSREGSRATVWHAVDPVERLGAALETIGTSFARLPYLKVYRYRIVSQGVDGRLTLQAVAPTAGVPDSLPVTVWPGLPGMHAKVKVGSQVLVVFLEGAANRPVVLSFDGSSPLELHLDAVTLIELGEGAVSFAAKATSVDAIFSALSTLCVAINTYIVAIQAVADPSNTATPTLTTALATFEAAIVTVAATLVKVK